MKKTIVILFLCFLSKGLLSAAPRVTNIGGFDVLSVSTYGVFAMSPLVTIGITTPTVSACGTSPLINGNDSAGVITVGTGGVATSCTVTFNNAWINAPSCWAANEGAILFVRTVTTKTTLVIDAASALTASGLIKYGCIGWKF